MEMADGSSGDDLPTFKRDAGGMLSATEKRISKTALEASGR